MRYLLMGALYLLPCFASGEPAVLNLIESFGDYFLHGEFDVDIKPSVTSIAPLNEEVKTMIGRNLRADIVIVGYGKRGEAGEFIGASKNILSGMPLDKIFPDIVKDPNKKWYIYFVDKDISHFVTDKKYIHKPQFGVS